MLVRKRTIRDTNLPSEQGYFRFARHPTTIHKLELSQCSMSALAILHQPILSDDIHVYRLESSLKSGTFWNVSFGVKMGR